MDLFDRPSATECLNQGAHSPIRCHPAPFDECIVWQLSQGTLSHTIAFTLISAGQWAWVGTALFKRSPSLEEGLFEVASNRHHFSGRLHRSAKGSVGCSEFIEGPAGDFDHTVIQCRFKGSGCPLASNRVWKFIQSIADCDFSRHSGNRIPSSLAC